MSAIVCPTKVIIFDNCSYEIPGKSYLFIVTLTCRLLVLKLNIYCPFIKVIL